MYYLDGQKSEISQCFVWISGRVDRKKQNTRTVLPSLEGKNGRNG